MVLHIETPLEKCFSSTSADVRKDLAWSYFSSLIMETAMLFMVMIELARPQDAIAAVVVSLRMICILCDVDVVRFVWISYSRQIV